MLIPLGLFIFLFLSTGGELEACEFTYLLTGPDHSETRIIPGIPVTVSVNGEYSLSISYREDHRNCLVPPEDTLFLVEEERWKEGKDYLALELQGPISWESDGRSHSASLLFSANKVGTWVLDVIRECTRSGYEQSLVIEVRG